MPRVLVTGGSGFLGGHIVRELRGAGVDVVALARSQASADAVAALGAQPVRGDVSDQQSLQAALRETTDAVFHVAADTNSWHAHNAQQTRTNVGGTRNVIAAARAAGVKRLVHTSSVSAFGQIDEVLTESMPRRGSLSWINYERNKAETELMVRDACLRGELDAVVLNPAHILGPGDRHNWARLFMLIDTGKLPGAPPGSGAFADVREVARAHVQAWKVGKSGESYLLGGEHASFLDLIQRIASQLGKPAPQRAMPAVLLRVYARMLDLISRVTRREPQLTPESLSYTCHHLRVDSSKAQHELGYRTTPLAQLIADTCVWLRENGLLSA
jgi:dihydroflavonol-4-reductase